MKYFIVEIDFGFENPYICIEKLLIFAEMARDKKNKLLSEIEAGLKDVKLMQDGKLPKKTLKQMLNGK